MTPAQGMERFRTALRELDESKGRAWTLEYLTGAVLALESVARSVRTRA